MSYTCPGTTELAKASAQGHREKKPDGHRCRLRGLFGGFRVGRANDNDDNSWFPSFLPMPLRGRLRKFPCSGQVYDMVCGRLFTRYC